MAEAFTWGAGGEAETSSSRARRRLAEALMMEGGSTAPIQSPWQGLDRVAKALMGGYQTGELDREDKLRDQEANALMQQHPAFAGMGASPGVAAVAPAMPAAAMPAGPLVPNNTNAVPGTVGMNQRLADLSYDFIDDNPGTALSSGVRSTADQARLYAERGSNPNPVAFPGTSRHEIGQAIDIGGMSPMQRQMLPQYGLAQPVANDPPHVELARPTMMASADPAALPVNAQEAQGYMIPGQPAARAAPAGPQMPPAVAAWVQKAIRNPATRASAVAVLGQYSKPRETYGEETDAQGNVWSVNQQTGQRTVALKKDKPEAAPPSVREYEYYKGTLPSGQPAMPYDQWSTAKARAAASNVTVNNGGGTDKQIFDSMEERFKAANATAQGLTGIRNAREAIEGGAITGFRADNRLSLQKAAQYFGVPLGEASKIENSEVFKSAIAPQVAAVLKSTVGNANISDSDRRFAERAAGGSLDLDEASIKRLLNIMERASTSHLEGYQKTLDDLYPDAEKNRRERALFGVRVVGGGKAAGTTETGIGWKVK